MTIRGVLFDVDGTLFDYREAEERGLHAKLAADGLLDRFASPAEALALWRSIVDEEYARFTGGELTFAEQQVTRTRRFLTAVGVPGAAEMEAAAADAWFQGYRDFRHSARRAYDDAVPLLTRLAPDYRLGVVSNSATAHQRDKLAAIGLLGFFTEPLVCSQEHGEAKPAAGIFHAGCRVLDLPPEEVAYIGDVYEGDALGARDAGLHAVWLDRDGAGAGVDGRPAGDGDGVVVIRTLTEFRLG